jgi:hypothetical protein
MTNKPEKFGPYKVHPVAAEFPLFDDARAAKLAISIKKNGLRRPIMLSADGTTILDGRKRYLACIAAGVEPTFERFREAATELDIIEFIMDENFERRDLDQGQKAAIRVAVDGYVEKLKGEAKERQRKAGATRNPQRQNRFGLNHLKRKTRKNPRRQRASVSPRT